ncbi:NACHT domain-containing protein [Streptomyces sp. NPDC058953]|uniref:NACHT domain-containing protein n=1 Tax=unclassified Streptomyces TaxID=2593676 RepID=UPI0036B3CCD3
MRNGPSMRVVAVLGGQQGTGVLLTSRYVLTCAHVLNGQHGAPSVLHLTSSRAVRCDIVKLWPGRDAALLRAEDDIVSDDRLGRLRIARLTRDDPLPGAQTTGFPGHQRYGGNKLDFGQYTGTVLPVAGQARGALTLWLDHTPGPPLADGRSPLAGLSGAPVLAGPVLLGMVARVNGAPGQQLEAVPIDALRNWAFDLLPVNPRLENMSGFDPADAPYEERYAGAVKAQYGKTEIFGIDELGVSESSWDLDTAYLSLEATDLDEGLRRTPQQLLAELRDTLPDDQVVDLGLPSGDKPLVMTREAEQRLRNLLETQPPGPAAGARRRVEQLIGRNPRTLLRGEAGAGKTTLVWRLAAHAACDTLPAELDELNGLIPFVVPMRSVRAHGSGFPAPDALAHAADLPVGRAPDGWAERALEAGRALLLVDGLDELPQGDRDRARGWLTRLLARYPDTRCLATVRPGAVEKDWLTAEGFGDLLLLPMSDEDIAAFVAAWHRAAKLEYAGRDEGRAAAELRRLGELSQRLTREFTGNRVLRDLARTPLLCAVICALHRKRRGRLPHTRWELYRATLDMLLGKRDRERGIDAPEGLTIGVDEHKLLLQHIAVWLVRCGQTQFTPAEAVQQIDKATGYMPQIREQGGAHRILAHLINRSGLLQQRTGATIQFIHRTFQDYLAAKELSETDSVGELVGRAGDELWRDVILLSVGHLDRRVGRLVTRLIEKADALPEPQARPLRILAGQCAANAVFLDAEARARAERAVRDVMPPSGDEESHLLAELGEYVLPLLPGPSGDAAADRLVIGVHARVGEAAAIPLLREFTDVSQPVIRGALARAWGSFPAEEYAREVLDRIDLRHIRLPVPTPEHLGLLKSITGVSSVALHGNHPVPALRAALPESGLLTVYFEDNAVLTDLRVIADRPSVHRLGLLGCPALTSLAHLADRTLESLITDARVFALRGARPRVHTLQIVDDAELSYDALAGWEPASLMVSSPARLSALTAVANRIPELHTLRLDSGTDLDSAATPSSHITDLLLFGPPSAPDTEVIARAFPHLTALRITTPPNISPYRLDLGPFHDSRPELRINVYADHTDQLLLTGHEHFGARLSTTP